MSIRIIVAAHKPYRMPEDELYLPLHVGAQGRETIGFARDDSGENISSKNPFYSELTGLYWAWKNLDADFIGLVHYRRYFSLKRGLLSRDRFRDILTMKQAEDLLKKHDVILPVKRNYLIENLYSHYVHTLYPQPLEIAGEIIRDRHPEYYPEFERLHVRTSAHMFNMFIMKRELLDEYCNWLFDILFELEKRVDASKYDAFHARFFGRISELLLDVWVNTKGIEYAQARVIDMENVNWLKKGASFLLAKFTGRKYGKSF